MVQGIRSIFGTHTFTFVVDMFKCKKIPVCFKHFLLLVHLNKSVLQFLVWAEI